MSNIHICFIITYLSTQILLNFIEVSIVIKFSKRDIKDSRECVRCTM